MKWFSKKRSIAKRVLDAQRRLDRLSTSELYEWGEQCLYVFGKCMLDSRHAENLVTAANMLEEAALAAEIAGLIAREVQTRVMR